MKWRDILNMKAMIDFMISINHNIKDNKDSCGYVAITGNPKGSRCDNFTGNNNLEHDKCFDCLCSLLNEDK